MTEKIQSIETHLMDGDIVLRCGRDITSEMMRIMNKSDHRFSHCGFVFTTAGKKMVYHSIGAEDSPEAVIRVESLENFFSPANNLAIGFAKMHYNEGEQILIKSMLDSLVRAKVPFDLNFNIDSDDSLYCTEMIAKTLKQINPKIIIPLTDTFGQKFYTIQNITENSRVDSVIYLKY